MKKKIFSKLFMTFITVCSTVFITLYAVGFRKDTAEKEGIYSDTLYNTIPTDSVYNVVFAVSDEDTAGTAADEVGTAASVTEAESKKNGTEAFDGNGNEHGQNDGVDTDTKKSFAGISSISVYNHRTDSVSDMPLEDYVACVVAAEMPGDSPMEALKAQAVAARTLAVRYVLDPDKSGHKGADICTDSGHCQSFVSKDELISRYGENGARVFENVRNAVNATKELILLYDSMPIVAVFHASSGGATASGKEVWGGDLAYLRSVETSEIYDEELRDKIVSEVTFTRDEVFEKLSGCDIPNLSEYKESPFHLWIGGKELTESGRVGKISIAGTEFSGTQVRKLFGLRSADFEISFGEDSITFITKGYGHGVGMSQLGAVAMAKNGESFYSILSAYYPGTIIGII